jgi:hypothetical protein
VNDSPPSTDDDLASPSTILRREPLNVAPQFPGRGWAIFSGFISIITGFVVSLSDVLTPRGWTTVQVIWDLSVKDNGDGTLQYTNSVTSHPTTDFHGLQREERCHFRGSCGRPPSRLQRRQPTRDPAVRRQHRAQSSRLRPDHIRTTAAPDRREAGRGKPTQASVTFPHSFMIVASRFEVCTWTALVQ